MFRHEHIIAPATGVFVACRSAGILSDAGFIIPGNILPVPVATNDIHVFLSGDKLSYLISFMRKVFVGIIIMLAQPVWTDNWGGTHQNFKCSIRFRNSFV